MSEFPKLLAAGPTFFLSSWFLMLFAGGLSVDTGIRPFGYLTSMVVTIALWIAVAPAVGAIASNTRRTGRGRERRPRQGGPQHPSL